MALDHDHLHDHFPTSTVTPSAFLLGGDGGGGKMLKMGAAGAIAGGVAYGFCKSKCPGSTGGILSNIPGVGMITGLLGGGNKAKQEAAMSEKDAEIAKLKAELAGAKNGEGGENAEEAAEPTPEDDAKKAAEAKEAKLHAELLKGENSACRLNCKIKSLMVAAAAAGAVSLMKGGPIDEFTAGPVFAALGIDEERRRRNKRSALCHPNNPVQNHSRFLGLDSLQAETSPALEALVPPTQWHEFLSMPVAA